MSLGLKKLDAYMFNLKTVAAISTYIWRELWSRKKPFLGVSKGVGGGEGEMFV